MIAVAGTTRQVFIHDSSRSRWMPDTIAEYLRNHPLTSEERAAVARVLGYPDGSTDQMVNDYLRTTRRAHAVVEHVFWE